MGLARRAVVATVWGAITLAVAIPSQAAPPAPPTASPAPTQPPPRKKPKYRLWWRPHWRKSEVGDYVWTAGMLGALGYMQFGMKVSDTPNWKGGILFDEWVRTWLPADTKDERLRWAKFSDWGWGIAMTLPWIESAIIPLADRGNWRLALELEMMNTEAFAFAGLVSRAGLVFVGRRRPNTETCHDARFNPNGADPKVVCFGGDNASFPSGHTAGAFTGAALSCVHHLELGLFGHPVADAGWCAAMMGLATFTGIARNVADVHYPTDTMFGAMIGIASGVGIPMIFHYGTAPGSLLERSYRIMPSSQGFGLQITGLF
jgi:membrane-associated phospholipid phosphatase